MIIEKEKHTVSDTWQPLGLPRGMLTSARRRHDIIKGSGSADVSSGPC